MKYCTKCGKQLDDNAAFCINCGAKAPILNPVTNESNVNTQQQQAPTQPQAPIQAQMQTQMQPKQSKGPVIAIVILCVLLLLAIGGVCFLVFSRMFGDNDKKKDDDNKTTTTEATSDEDVTEEDTEEDTEEETTESETSSDQEISDSELKKAYAAMEQYITAIANTDYESYYEVLYPQEVHSKLDDYITDYGYSTFEEYLEALFETLDTGITVSDFSFDNAQIYDADSVDTIEESFETNLGFSLPIDTIIQADVTYTYTQDGVDNEETETLIAYKSYGKWFASYLE